MYRRPPVNAYQKLLVPQAASAPQDVLLIGGQPVQPDYFVLELHGALAGARLAEGKGPHRFKTIDAAAQFAAGTRDPWSLRAHAPVPGASAWLDGKGGAGMDTGYRELHNPPSVMTDQFKAKVAEARTRKAPAAPRS